MDKYDKSITASTGGSFTPTTTSANLIEEPVIEVDLNTSITEGSVAEKEGFGTLPSADKIYSPKKIVVRKYILFKKKGN